MKRKIIDRLESILTRRISSQLSEANRRILELEGKIDSLLMLAAKDRIEKMSQQKFDDIKDTEFKVYSQTGEDGIVQYLLQNIDVCNDKFIEFGVENYREANTRLLLCNNNWKGLIIEADDIKVDQIRKENLYWQYDITAVSAFISCENINDLFYENGFTGNIGLLSIDIDGNDYWVWKSIDKIQPDIVVIEYNSVFGLNPWTIPYAPDFIAGKAHHSHLYFGASLTSLYDLGMEKGYEFLGSNRNGSNAFFVKKERAEGVKELITTPELSFVESRFRSSRDEFGNLTFVNADERLRLLKGMSVYNTRLKKLETIG